MRTDGLAGFPGLGIVVCVLRMIGVVPVCAHKQVAIMFASGNFSQHIMR